MAAGQRVKEGKDWQVPIALFLIFDFFPVGLPIHSSSEFQENHRFLILVETVSIWSEVAEGLDCLFKFFSGARSECRFL